MPRIAGTAKDVVDRLESWFRKHAADGFMISPAYLPAGFDEFVENVVPENEAAGVYPANTLTAYATPWGGLNLARVDPLGHVEVYWWSPASNEWARESLNTEAGSYLSRFRAVGRLQSAVSAQGEMDVFARNELGDLFRFNWSLARPQWLLERM